MRLFVSVTPITSDISMRCFRLSVYKPCTGIKSSSDGRLWLGRWAEGNYRRIRSNHISVKPKKSATIIYYVFLAVATYRYENTASSKNSASLKYIAHEKHTQCQLTLLHYLSAPTRERRITMRAEWVGYSHMSFCGCAFTIRQTRWNLKVSIRRPVPTTPSVLVLGSKHSKCHELDQVRNGWWQSLSAIRK